MGDMPIFCKTYGPDDSTSFWRYPEHKVLAIFDEPEDVSATLSHLREHGIDKGSIEVFCGGQGEKQIDFTGEEHGWFAAFVRSMQALSAEHLYLDYYQSELHAGKFLVQVAVKGREQKTDVAKILHDSGGKRVTHFGNWLIEEIGNKPEHVELGSYGISRNVELSFQEAVSRIKAALADEGFGVLTEIDMKEKFKEKLNKDFENYVILGACNPDFAFEALQKDMELGLLLPCNVVVYGSDSRTVVAVIDPVRMMALANNTELNQIAIEVEKRLRRALDSI